MKPQAGAPGEQGEQGERAGFPTLLEQAEAACWLESGERELDPSQLPPALLKQKLHELRVHQIELEMQNEELRRAQLELEASRARYFDLYDLAPVGYCSLSEEGLILQANLSASLLLGQTRVELLKQRISRFILREDQDSYYLLRKKLLKTGEKQSCELRILKGDGSVAWVQIDATLAIDEQAPAVLQMVLTEVTKARQLEASRLQIEGRYRSLIAELQVGVVISSANSEIVLSNQVARDLLDLSDDQLLGRSSYDRRWNVTYEDGSDFPPAQHPAVLAVTNAAPVHNVVMGVFRPSLQDRVWLLVTANPQLSPEGRVQQVVTTFVDVSERRKAQRVGVESRQQLHGLVESAMDAIITVDDSLRIVLFNSAACVMFGVAAEQVLGTDVERFLPARFRQGHSQQVRSFGEQGRTARSMGKLGYVMALRANGEEFPAEASISHVEIEGKKHYTAIMRDITARKQAQEALESSLLEKEALLKEVHHRVKNNLQVISSLLRLEAGRSAQPDTKSVLGDMQGRIRSMALLHEMLYRSGNFAAVDLGVFIKQLASQVFRMQTSQQGSVRLLLELDSVRVGMDQAAPCGLLVNELISNSLKHGFPDGRSGVVRVALRAVGDGEAAVAAGSGASSGSGAEGCAWRLSVSDDGVGLPDDFVPNSGQSLGLLLVEDLARQLHGRLETERHISNSNSNSGVTFSVTFKLDALDLPPAEL